MAVLHQRNTNELLTEEILIAGNTIITTDATPFVALSYPTDLKNYKIILGWGASTPSTNNFFSGDSFEVAFGRETGTLVKLSEGITMDINNYSTGTPSFDTVVNGNNIDFVVTGIASTTIRWVLRAQVLYRTT